MVERLRAFARQAMAPLYPLSVLAVAWELLSRSGWVSPRLMPSIVKVGRAFVEGLANGDLVYHASISFSRALSGFGLAIVIGLVAALLSRRNYVPPIPEAAPAELEHAGHADEHAIAQH